MLEKNPLIGSVHGRIGIVFRGEDQVIFELFDVLPFLEDCAIDINAPATSEEEVIFLSARAIFGPKTVNPTLEVVSLDDVTFFTSCDGQAVHAINNPTNKLDGQDASNIVSISKPFETNSMDTSVFSQFEDQTTHLVDDFQFAKQAHNTPMTPMVMNVNTQQITPRTPSIDLTVINKTMHDGRVYEVLKSNKSPTKGKKVDFELKMIEKLKQNTRNEIPNYFDYITSDGKHIQNHHVYRLVR